MDSINNIVKKLREGRLSEEREDYSSYATKELISLAQEGDSFALEVLVNNYEDFIRKVSSKYFFGKDYDKEDVEQIATIAFWDAVMKWDKSGDFEAFAGMVMKRKLVDELNKVSAEKRYLNQSAQSFDTPLAGEDDDMTIGDTLASKSGSAEDEYMGIEGYKALKSFMENTLSDNERKVIRMYIQGYKVSQIAEEIGMKYKSAENAIQRVKGKVADYLRARESKKIKEDINVVEFTEEEKKILSNILDKIEESKSAR